MQNRGRDQQRKMENIPFEVEVNGHITWDKETVLTIWKDSFQGLLNPVSVDTSEHAPTDAASGTDCDFNLDITYEEVKGRLLEQGWVKASESMKFQSKF